MIVGFGAHLIKVGLSGVLIDLCQRGVVTALATNGASAVHDFELATVGFTSEDVEAALEGGDFGVAEETGGARPSRGTAWSPGHCRRRVGTTDTLREVCPRPHTKKPERGS